MQRKARWSAPARAALVALGLGLLGLAAVARLWPGQTTSGPVPVAARVTATAPLQVGAAEVPLPLPAHPALAGFGLFRPRARATTGPLFARAVSFGPFAIVALDLLEVPRALQAAVSERLPGKLVWVCATHTHSGPGGYDPSPLPQLAGARRYDPALFAGLVDAAVGAVEEAGRSAAPASLRLARAAHPELERGRSPGATPDPTLWALEASGPKGRLATLAAFGAHPTLVSRADATLSGDWPGAAATALAPAVVVQGVGGDSSPVAPSGNPAERLVAYGFELREAVEEALANGHGSVRGGVEAEVRPVEVTFAPLLGHGTRLTTSVGIARVGDATLVCLPGELTGAALEDLVASAPWVRDAFVITLCGDELSYVESPRLRGAGLGEKLVLFPDAVAAFGEALRAPRP